MNYIFFFKFVVWSSHCFFFHCVELFNYLWFYLFVFPFIFYIAFRMSSKASQFPFHSPKAFAVSHNLSASFLTFMSLIILKLIIEFVLWQFHTSVYIIHPVYSHFHILPSPDHSILLSFSGQLSFSHSWLFSLLWDLWRLMRIICEIRSMKQSVGTWWVQ